LPDALAETGQRLIVVSEVIVRRGQLERHRRQPEVPVGPMNECIHRDGVLPLGQLGWEDCVLETTDRGVRLGTQGRVTDNVAAMATQVRAAGGRAVDEDLDLAGWP
jgi:hypothetical protein